MAKPVAITHCQTYGQEELAERLAEICDAAHMPDVAGKTVLLKPNILWDAPVEKGITTHPEVLRATIRLLYARGAKTIFVGDSPSMQRAFFTARLSGITQACEQEGAFWCDFFEEPLWNSTKNTSRNKFVLPHILESVDLLFSLAKMKTHSFMYTTGCVKNLFGLVVGLHKSSCHFKYPTREAFARMLATLYAQVHPDFGIMDAIVSMEGAGPSAGSLRHTALLLASCDLSAVDVAQSIIMGYDPMSIVLTKELWRRRLTSWERIDDIPYPLVSANDLVIADFKRIRQYRRSTIIAPLVALLGNRYLGAIERRHDLRPIFTSDLCTGCGRCVTICAAHALSLDSRQKVVVDYQRCIRCYCCHEVCAFGAIRIEPKE